MSVAGHRAADTVAGFLAAFAMALSAIAVVRQPGLLAPVAVLVGLVAVRMTEVHRRLAEIAVVAATLAFLVGMTVAVLTDAPLY